MEKKSNHRSNVVRIADVFPHPNADRLEIILIGGYQCVIQKDSLKVGDLAVYIQPDSVVPQTSPFRFIWEPHVQIDGTVPERRRRITVRRFRGEWSEGLLLPVGDFEALVDPTLTDHPSVKEGDDVSDLLGITHYDPETEEVAKSEGTYARPKPGPRRKYPTSAKGWLFFLLDKVTKRHFHKYRDEVAYPVPTYDVEAMKNFMDTFYLGEGVVVTEKIHGSNARFLYLDGEMYVGSRNQWKDKGEVNVWTKALAQNQWIERWCRENEGFTLYGEVTPTQKNFAYGSEAGEVRFFLFDVRTPMGGWLPYAEYPDYGIADSWIEGPPLLYLGPYEPTRIKALVSGPSEVGGAHHMREGIVIKSLIERTQPGLGRTQLKLVSNEFLERDSRK